jgi:hypothetical protein
MQEDVRGLGPWAARHTPCTKLDCALSESGPRTRENPVEGYVEMQGSGGNRQRQGNTGTPCIADPAAPGGHPACPGTYATTARRTQVTHRDPESPPR